MAAAVAPVAASAPKTSAAVLALLRLLAGPEAGGRLRLVGRSRQGFGQRELFLPAGPQEWIPTPLLTLLEEDWALHAGVLVRGESGLAPLKVNVLAAAWAVPLVMVNPQRPASEYGRRPWPDAAGLAKAAASAAGAPWGPPALVVDAQTSIVTLWALRAPIPVKTETDAARVALLFRAVAASLGAEVPPAEARLDYLGVPVPGSAVREGAGGYVACRSLNAGAVVDLADVESALNGKGRGRR